MLYSKKRDEIQTIKDRLDTKIVDELFGNLDKAKLNELIRTKSLTMEVDQKIEIEEIGNR